MVSSIAISIGLFLGLLAGIDIGGRLRNRLLDDEKGTGTAAADGVVFAVLGLLIAFTLTASGSKFDQRRHLLVDQANALGTAHLRLDVLGVDEQTAVRAKMVQWLDLAMKTNQFMHGTSAEYTAAVAEADRLQSQVWQMTLAAAEKQDQPAIVSFVMSPINDWIDLTSTRAAMNDMGLPPLVLPTLIVLSLIGSVLAGFGMGRPFTRTVLHRLAFAGAISFSIYVILDLNHPREGLISVDSMDNAFIQLRQSIVGGMPQ